PQPADDRCPLQQHAEQQAGESRRAADQATEDLHGHQRGTQRHRESSGRGRNRLPMPLQQEHRADHRRHRKLQQHRAQCEAPTGVETVEHVTSPHRFPPGGTDTATNHDSIRKSISVPRLQRQAANAAATCPAARFECRLCRLIHQRKGPDWGSPALAAAREGGGPPAGCHSGCSVAYFAAAFFAAGAVTASLAAWRCSCTSACSDSAAFCVTAMISCETATARSACSRLRLAPFSHRPRRASASRVSSASATKAAESRVCCSNALSCSPATVSRLFRASDCALNAPSVICLV